MSYSGLQTVRRTASVGTAWNGVSVTESPSTTTESYDRFGRLARVTEPSGSGGAGVTTNYSYDSGNRLSLVSTTSAGTTQRRVFNYDHRGFLNFETHPETAPNSLGNGHHKDYLANDSRGHAHRTVEGANDLSYTFDFMERLHLVYNTLQGPNCTPSPITTPTCVKQFTYDNIAAGALGRVYQASRFNHILYGGVPYTDEWTYTYTYQGLDGRVSQRNLQHTFNGQAGPGQESFNQSWVYTQLGKIDTETYPTCGSSFTPCSGFTARAVPNLYTSGFLTAVPGYTAGPGITYYPNGMVNSVGHSNNVTATYSPDPYGMPRPSSIAAAGPSGPLWSSGSYAFDGSGNVVQMGHGYDQYDLVGRLTVAQVQTNALDNANPALSTFTSQTVTYDAFGNIQSFPTNNATPTDPATNHLTGGTYDASGNLRSWNGPPPNYLVPTYDYDELDKLKHYKNGGQEWYYMYDADDERVWSFQPPVNGLARFDRWTLRGLDGKVRRLVELYGDNWTNAWGGSNLWEDYIYRDGTLLAAYMSNLQQRHMDVDHLGTPRLLTNYGGIQSSYHVYLPYGVEATPFNQDQERMKFTGHERDLADPSSPADDLDYMHARFTNPLTGRFLNIDHAGGDQRRPQSWNRYCYATGNPVTMVDPNGLDPLSSSLLQFYNTFFHADFSKVDVQSGITAKALTAAAGADAVTIGSNIYLSGPSLDPAREGTAPEVFALLGHELTHVVQYQVIGLTNFFGLYVASYQKNQEAGQSDDAAYKNIIQEQVAFRVQGVLTDFLAVHPEIAKKLAAGDPLTKDEKALAGQALSDASKNGKFPTGYQFIEGFLLRIAPPQ